MDREVLERFTSAPSRAGIFVDFDGTLSDIVLRPEDARPVEGARDVLGALADRYAVVAVVSGRSAHQLVEWLGPRVEIWGLHGAQRAIGGRVDLADSARGYRPMMQEVLGRARASVEAAGLTGAMVEDKDVMVTLHYRAADDHDRARTEMDRISQELAGEFELARAKGKESFELRPPIEFTKRDVLIRRTLEEGLEAVAFVGDDLVDLPAFDALDDLAAGGTVAVRIAVSSDEAPRELLDRADLVVDAPAGVVELLRSFAEG